MNWISPLFALFLCFVLFTLAVRCFQLEQFLFFLTVLPCLKEAQCTNCHSFYSSTSLKTARKVPFTPFSLSNFKKKTRGVWFRSQHTDLGAKAHKHSFFVVVLSSILVRTPQFFLFISTLADLYWEVEATLVLQGGRRELSE